MSIGAIGNTIYVNQQTASVSSILSNNVSIQNTNNQEMVKEKNDKILEIRPTEKNQRTNKDKEDTNQNYQLDIKV